MIRLGLVGAALALSACGIDGAPIAPQYTVTQSFAINSKTGPRSETALYIDLTKRAGDTAAEPESEY